jgi:hypothetical protein
MATAAAISMLRALKRRLRLRHAAARRAREALSDACQREGAATSGLGADIGTSSLSRAYGVS